MKDMTSKNLKVTIFGKDYTLISDESDEILSASAKLVDAFMRDISQKARHLSVDQVAVLAALQLASQMLGAQRTLAVTQERAQDLINKIDTELCSALK